MTAKEAYKILSEKRPELAAVSCFEYDSRFAFSMMPDGADPDIVDKLIDCLLSVHKKTGEVRDFKPFHISVEEYRAGKRIVDFK